MSLVNQPESPMGERRRGQSAMTDAAELPSTAPVFKRWRVELVPDHAARIIEAHGFRIEGSGLIFVQPAGSVAAFAPGCWRTIEAAE